ncbi:MAG: hypothetical protein PHE49_09225 [bacterium]|nr:hypothetical protein [bacterium]
MEEKTTNISRPKEVTIVAILLFALAVLSLVLFFSTKIPLKWNEALAQLLGILLYALLGFGMLKMIAGIRILTIVLYILNLLIGIYSTILHGFELTALMIILDVGIITLLLLKSTREAFNKTETERNKKAAARLESNWKKMEAATLKEIREKDGISSEEEK